MTAILKREINSFFTSPVAYLVMGLFMVITGLFLWVFKGPYNIIDSGFASLSPFFELVPWIFVFLIPAITMRSFADERQGGTLEVLLTKPVSTLGIVTGKFLASFILVIITLLPTLIYVYSLYTLGNPPGNLDGGSIAGSYLGLLFLAMSFIAIGLFASSITSNQIIAFILGVAVCFTFLFIPGSIAMLDNSFAWVTELGILAHFQSIGRGVVSLPDLVYFITLTVFFLIITSRFLRK